MNDRLYYKYKQKIEFYLDTQNITDLTKFNFSINEDHSLNIYRWEYENIPKPTKENLKTLKANNLDRFINHRKDNLLLHKEKFILCLEFDPGTYVSGTVLFDK